MSRYGDLAGRPPSFDTGRILITGSRAWRAVQVISDALWWAIDGGMPHNYIVIGGCASGADAIARALALDRGCQVEDHWPDYAHYLFGDANKRRNQQMADAGADVCLAFPTRNSRGTRHAISCAVGAGIPVRVFDEAGGSRWEQKPSQLAQMPGFQTGKSQPKGARASGR